MGLLLNINIQIPVLLVNNKCDLLQGVESFTAGAKMEQACRKYGFTGWFVTSAKAGTNVEGMMDRLIKEMRESNVPSGHEEINSSAIKKQTWKEKSCVLGG